MTRIIARGTGMEEQRVEGRCVGITDGDPLSIALGIAPGEGAGGEKFEELIPLSVRSLRVRCEQDVASFRLRMHKGWGYTLKEMPFD